MCGSSAGGYATSQVSFVGANVTPLFTSDPPPTPAATSAEIPLAVILGDASPILPPADGPAFTSSSRPVVGVQLSAPGGNVLYRLPPHTRRSQPTRGSPFCVFGSAS